MRDDILFFIRNKRRDAIKGSKTQPEPAARGERASSMSELSADSWTRTSTATTDWTGVRRDETRLNRRLQIGRAHV